MDQDWNIIIFKVFNGLEERGIIGEVFLAGIEGGLKVHLIGLHWDVDNCGVE